MVIGILILILLLVALPVFVGGIPVCMSREKVRWGLPARWVAGQFLLWAGFQLICVPLVLRQVDFVRVEISYKIFLLAMVVLAGAMEIRKRARNLSFRTHYVRERAKGTNFIFWILFFVLLLFQLMQAVTLAYADGDDAYYVAVSVITDDAGSMYTKLPYTGGIGGTELDVRHGLAPFPLWITFLARMAGLHAAVVAHTMLPVMLIAMTYAIFWMIGERLFPEKDGKLPLFLIFTQLLVLFGDFSFSSAENFMIARSRQGKAALGSIVIPFIVYLMIVLLQKLQAKEKISKAYYLMVLAAAVTGCLCSTLGALLVCMLLGIVGLLGTFCYKTRRFLLPMAGCCIPCVVYAFLYLFLK